ncbi:MAG TPA: dihydroorotase, partial [Bacillota bacterium]|nr:dihydroorotase [Bacillota bacterium]
LACMPNTAPPVDNPLVVGYIQQKAREAGLARVYPVGALTRNRQGEFMADYSALYAAGVRAFSDDGDPVDNSYLLYQIFKYLLAFEDTLIISHCEDRRLAANGLVHEGYWSNLLGLPGIPPAAETVAVAREILLAQATGKRLHLAHISTAGAVEWIRWAKEKGLPVTAEVTPHHLLLTDAAVKGYNTAAKVNPPLRSEEDRQALLQGLREGIIDVIATDHAPHKIDEKDLDYFEAPFGVIGLETAVPMLLTELVHRGELSLRELVQAYSCRSARILGVPGGTLKPGAPADIAVLDLEAEGVIEPRRFYSKARNTPFAGRKVRGLPVLTLLGGEIKMEEGAVKVGKQE